MAKKQKKIIRISEQIGRLPDNFDGSNEHLLRILNKKVEEGEIIIPKFKNEYYDPTKHTKFFNKR